VLMRVVGRICKCNLNGFNPLFHPSISWANTTHSASLLPTPGMIFQSQYKIMGTV
jgi:hypothetical protein